MDVLLEYTEEVPTPFAGKFFQTVATRTLEGCDFPFLRGKIIRLSAVAVSEERIRDLNLTYRDKDVVTDILSFGEYADRGALAQETKTDLFLGDLFFCPAFIGTAAREDAVTFEREMAYIFSHGVLHLVGFDHEEEMFVIQDAVTDDCLRKTSHQS